ncbi:TetR-like C-terminal domain-containing protein [Mycolicibacterium hippocampi]|uniref:TetR-like C-terminal domain-containing protein n=1 Tax=Mycolicibacterium hippocampi TaxID=659824 RepID=UPI0035178EE2
MVDDRPLADVDRERVVAAVHEEVARWGIDRFDLGSMAHRHGLDEQAILQHWRDPETLILDALARRPGDGDGPPDTGSLRSDLFVLAVRMATLVTSMAGRKLHGGHLIGDTRISSVEIRQTAWRERANSLGVVFDRARERGELRSGVDFRNVLELLFAPINMRALYTGEPVDDDYCRTVSELVYCAVAAG